MMAARADDAAGARGAAGRVSGALTDNAAHPLETEAVRLVGHLLARRWPWQRVSIEVRFMLFGDKASDSQLKVEVADGYLYGRARVMFNYLFLIQDEGVFLRHIVAHELAHILADADARAAGAKIERHGIEWQDHLARLSSETPATPSPARELGGSVFDGRAVRLLRQGQPARCDCPDGWYVWTGGYQKRIDNQQCKRCGATYRASTTEEAPDDVMQAYQYIRYEHAFRG